MRVKTGISGLDKLLGGGIPEDSVVLLSGGAGTGKTIFGLQFIAEGALKYGERGLYVTFEEKETKIREQAAEFGWNLQELEKKGMVRVVNISKFAIGEILKELSREIKGFKPDRLAVDSVTDMCLAAHARTRPFDLDKAEVEEMIGTQERAGTPLDWDGIIIKKMIIELMGLLQEKHITAILISEVQRDSPWYSRDTITEFACDGIIMLKAVSIGGDMQRTVEIVKMRNTPIEGGIYNFEFTGKGVRIST